MSALCLHAGRPYTGCVAPRRARASAADAAQYPASLVTNIPSDLDAVPLVKDLDADARADASLAGECCSTIVQHRQALTSTQ